MHPLLVARYMPNDVGRTRFGMSTGRRVGSAVVRNRVRRRLRESIRAHAAEIEPGWDVLLVARAPSATAGYAELDGALKRVLGAAKLLGRAHAASTMSTSGGSRLRTTDERVGVDA